MADPVKTVSIVDISKERIVYTWNDINVWVGDGNGDGDGEPQKKRFWNRGTNKSKQILKNVTGIVRPGELLAIMGASGAGKTTLLNCLTFRNTGKLRMSGQRSVNGAAVTPDMLTSVSAYIQQEDLFIGTLTVREHLVFQALVRMHAHIPYKTRMDRVEEVIVEFGLAKAADTVIGVAGRVKGISGGEMKRLAFASEVLTDPSLLFCDEPTSGLDSYMAHNIVCVLKKMAEKGKTIICTIHQPSSEVFELFDKIILMSEGRTAFLGDAKRAVAFFDNLGFPVPVNYNPSDYFISTLAIQPGNEEKCRIQSSMFCDKYGSSEPAAEVLRDIRLNETHSYGINFVNGQHSSFKRQNPYKASWFAQFRALTWRSWLSTVREPLLLKVRIIQTLMVSILLGIIYLGQELTQEGVMNINGALFLIITNLTFTSLFGVVNVFCTELPIFLREHFNGMYRTDTYFLSKMLTEVPLFVFFPILFVSISYYMIGLNAPFERFAITCGIAILVCSVACAFGYLVSCFAPNVGIALALAPACLIPMMLFGGFFLNKDSVPVYFIWLKYISWFLYGNEALAINQWSGIDEITCTHNSTCPANGDIVLQTLNFDKDNFTIDIIALVALAVGYRIVAFFALLSKTLRKAN